jgi:TatD DNase family protein
MLIDTHAHLNFPDYRDQPLADILDRAKAAGVERVINVGTDLETSRVSVELAQEYENIFAAVGIHPHDAANIKEKDLATIYDLAKDNPKVVAIGEIGLDYYRESDEDKKKGQREVFAELITIAKELDLPYIVHSREALSEVLAIVKEHKYPRAVMHCFGEDAVAAQEVIAAGLHLSFTGIVTFKNARNVQEAAKVVPLERLMLETDCPFLAPTPHRGLRNEPAFLADIAKHLAQLKELSFAELARATTNTATAFFSRLSQEGKSS